MQFTLDFDGSVTGSNAVEIDAEAGSTGTGTSVIGVESYFCNSNGDELTGVDLTTPIAQGDSIFICAVSDAPTLARVNTIDTLNVTANNSGEIITQQVILSGGVNSIVSDLQCSDGACKVEVVLLAGFFPSLTDGESLTLEAVGTAELLVGARRRSLVRASNTKTTLRSLQESEMREFGTPALTLRTVDADTNSGAFDVSIPALYWSIPFIMSLVGGVVVV